MFAKFDDDEVGGVRVGPALRAFLDRIAPVSARAALERDAVQILSQCALRVGDPSVTGVVVGQVQSGKTLSYEALIALAHDSGFPIVVVISGTSNPLLDQGAGRIRRDLTAAGGPWTFLTNPSLQDRTAAELLRKVIDDWSDSDLPESMRRTAVITVLKHHGQLAKLGDLLRSLGSDTYPVLIIDDEADQASLNTAVRRNRESTTYRVLSALRSSLRTFSYVQYTATPQALLLINIADVLSPSFVHVLDAGDGYTGGEFFFSESADIVRTIPFGDLAAASPAGGPRPNSFDEALLLFFVGLAVEIYRGADRSITRSMLVHPSQETDPHERFEHWARMSREQWLDILRNADEYPADLKALEERLETARADLIAGGLVVPSLVDLRPHLRLALRDTVVLTMNAANGPTPTVPWDQAMGFILVGGQAVDRGYTVEGLTVTYMPRGLGMGNADSLEQRARFFGYKAAYAALCRVYLEGTVFDAFVDYVAHEADIRRRLREVQLAGTPLSEWRRAFILDRRLSPTRSAVLSVPALADEVADDWRVIDALALDETDLDTFRGTVEQHLALLEFEPDTGDARRTAAQRHQVAESMSLNALTRLIRAAPVEDTAVSMLRTGLTVQLERISREVPDETVTVVRMRPTETSRRALRARDDRVRELFQGQNVAGRGAAQGDIYPGDRAVRSQDGITLQVHLLDLTRGGTLVASKVPVFAIWIPARLSTGWYVQDLQ